MRARTLVLLDFCAAALAVVLLALLIHGGRSHAKPVTQLPGPAGVRPWVPRRRLRLPVDSRPGP